MMKPIDNDKLLAWTTRLIALRAAAKGTTKYEEALVLKAELMERAEKRMSQSRSPGNTLKKTLYKNPPSTE